MHLSARQRFARDNIRLGQREARPPTRTTLSAAPKPFSALFDELSPYFLIFWSYVLIPQYFTANRGGYQTKWQDVKFPSNDLINEN